MDNSLKILNHLGKNTGRKYTMHELSKTLKIPYATFHRTIQGMTDLLTTEKVGKSKTIQLKDNPVIEAYLTISSDEERKEYLKNQPIIRKISNEMETEDIVILFGSYAKGKQTKESDIDILIINEAGKKTLSFSKYETLFKKKINPIFITKQEFKKMLKAKEENVGKQALKNHIILKNPEKFWRITWKNTKNNSNNT